VHELDYAKLVPRCIEVRGVKVTVSDIDIPVSYAAAFEGERVRREDMHVEFGGKQLQSLTVMAQSVGLAPVVAKIKLHADGRIARTTIHLDAAELEALEAQLDGSASQPKEGVPQ
jgi:hypothetical protein